jgi:hypothetical protein
MRTFHLFIIILFISNLSLGQVYTTNNWFFGNNAGIDLNYGIAVPTIGGQINNFEGCATVGDELGNLLFYTDGMNVWDKTHMVMYNGGGLLGHISATQSAIIVPYPDSINLFYVFTVDAADNHLLNGLCYSIIDINLNAGLGAVTSTKNVELANPVSEKITAINNFLTSDIWVVAHKWNSNEFIAFNISSNGIDTIPTISNIGSVHQGGAGGTQTNGYTNSVGYMKANLQGSQIALTIHTLGKIELFDFDVQSGFLSNCVSSSSSYDWVYGIEFSPDGNLLYVSTIYNGSKLYQFDLTLGNPFTSPYIMSSSNGYQISALQIAQDGRIYSSERYNNYLSYIEFPNYGGSLCNYLSDGIFLNSMQCQRGLPSIFNTRSLNFVNGSILDTIICEGDSVCMSNSNYFTSGFYHDTLLASSGWDSVVNLNLTVVLPPTIPTISETGGYLFTDVGYSYLWYLNGIILPNDTGNSILANGSGNYQVEIFNLNGCSSISEVFSYTNANLDEERLINIYPNPSNGEIQILAPQEIKIEVFNLSGQVVDFESQNTDRGYKIIFNKLVESIYIIKIQTSTSSIIRKLYIRY